MRYIASWRAYAIRWRRERPRNSAGAMWVASATALTISSNSGIVLFARACQTRLLAPPGVVSAHRQIGAVVEPENVCEVFGLVAARSRTALRLDLFRDAGQ